jgi:hypothetical protein
LAIVFIVWGLNSGSNPEVNRNNAQYGKWRRRPLMERACREALGDKIDAFSYPRTSACRFH